MARMYDPGSTKRQQALMRKQQPRPVPPPPMEATRPPLGMGNLRRREALERRQVSGRAGGGGLPAQRAFAPAPPGRGLLDEIGGSIGSQWRGAGETLSGQRYFDIYKGGFRPEGPRRMVEDVITGLSIGGIPGAGQALTKIPGAGRVLGWGERAIAPVTERLGALTRYLARGGSREAAGRAAEEGIETGAKRLGEEVLEQGAKKVGQEATEQVAKAGIREGTAAGEEAIEAGMRAGQRELGREASRYMPPKVSTMEDLLSKAGTTIARTGPGAAVVSLAAKPFVQGVMQTAPYVGAGLVPTEPPPAQPGQTPPPQPTTPPTTVEEASKAAMARLAQAGIGGGGVTQPQQPPALLEGEQPPPGGGPGELPNIPGEQPPTERGEPGGVSSNEDIIRDVQSGYNDLVSTLNDSLTRNDTEAVGLTAAFAQSFLDDIARMRSDLVAMYEQMGQEIDPATQAMLDNLEKTLQDQLSAAEEEAKRRGMYWSGILEEGKLRLRTGYMSDRAKMLGERLSGIRDQMWQALNNLYNSATGQLGNIYQTGLTGEYTARENAAQRRADLMNELLRQRMDLERIRADERRRQQEEARLERKQQEEYERWLAEQWARQTGTIAPGLPGAGGPTWERQYQQGQLNLRAQQAGGASRAAGTDASATQYILQSLRGLPVDQALAQLDAEAGELASMGVDVNYVRDRILREAGTGMGTLGVLGGR